jgi:hypothetical protein
MRTAVITALFAIAPIVAQADGQGFITASAGQAHYSGDTGSSGTYTYDNFQATQHVDKKDTAFGVTGGYRWMIDDVFSIGPEAGFVDLGKLSYRLDTTYSPLPQLATETTDTEIKNKAALLGVNAKWMLGHSWSLGLRTGFLHTWSRLHSEGQYSDRLGLSYSGTYRESSHDNGFYGALNVGYDFTRNFGVTLSYEHYQSDYKSDEGSISQKIGVWSAGAEFRF